MMGKSQRGWVAARHHVSLFQVPLFLFPELYYFPQISILTGLFLLNLAPRSSPRPHSDTVASLGPPTGRTIAGQTPRLGLSTRGIPYRPRGRRPRRRLHGSGTNRKAAMLGLDQLLVGSAVVRGGAVPVLRPGASCGRLLGRPFVT